MKYDQVPIDSSTPNHGTSIRLVEASVTTLHEEANKLDDTVELNEGSTPSHYPITYRPDIDGLRTLAVVPVVIFHAYPHILTGGFIGVDIFFVISGYLISGILFKEFQKGSFTYSGFYSRRVRRIFPGLLL
ncbi:acyltransferase family protein, partial [Thraustotheca clavata]